jgi:hypothetical protein
MYKNTARQTVRRTVARDRRAVNDVLNCVARQNTAMTTGAFAAAARLAERAAGIARTGGDLADASLELSSAAVCHLLDSDAPAAVPLARDALALARQADAPALVVSGLLAVGLAVAETDPGQAPACLRARKPRTQHRARLPEHPRPQLGGRDRVSRRRPGRHTRTRQCYPRPPVGQWSPDGLRPVHHRGHSRRHPA